MFWEDVMIISELDQVMCENRNAELLVQEVYRINPNIKFTILKDGTIVTDSDCLPNDVNEKAHEAMDILEQHLGNKRVMTKKPVPAKYASKMKPRRIINIEQNL